MVEIIAFNSRMAVAQIDSRPWLKQYPPEIPATLEYREAPLYSLLEDAASAYPDLPALRFATHRLTFAQVWAQAQRFAAALAALGLVKGDRVALMLPNCPQYVIAYYGTLRAGGIVAQVNPLYTPRELDYLLNDSGAEVIVVADVLYPVLQAANVSLKHVLVATLKGDVPLGLGHYVSKKSWRRRPARRQRSRSIRARTSRRCNTRAGPRYLEGGHVDALQPARQRAAMPRLEPERRPAWLRAHPERHSALPFLRHDVLHELRPGQRVRADPVAAVRPQRGHGDDQGHPADVFPGRADDVRGRLEFSECRGLRRQLDQVLQLRRGAAAARSHRGIRAALWRQDPRGLRPQRDVAGGNRPTVHARAAPGTVGMPMPDTECEIVDVETGHAGAAAWRSRRDPHSRSAGDEGVLEPP